MSVLKNISFKIVSEGENQFTTPSAIYTAFTKLRVCKTALQVTVNIQHAEHSNRRMKLKLDLYDHIQIGKLSKTIENNTTIPQKTIEQELIEFSYHIQEALENPETFKKEVKVENTKSVKSFLQRKDLLEQIGLYIGNNGIVGEERNRTITFLILISFKSTRPLHGVIKGASATGKTHLAEKVSQFLPKEAVKSSAVITQSAFLNYSKDELMNKTLIIEDLTGIHKQAEYHLREIQSKKSLMVARFDHETGQTINKEIKSHMSSISCTTKDKLYRDNENRSFILYTDDSEEQTKRINHYKAKVEAGQIDKKKQKEQREIVQNAIRLLELREVVNPYAELISLPEEARDKRRLQDLLFGLIRTITVLYQYQRDTNDNGAIISTKEDVEAAVELLGEMFIDKSDELSKTQRKFFEELKAYLIGKAEEYVEIKQVQFTTDELVDNLSDTPKTMYRKLSELRKQGWVKVAEGNQKSGYKFQLAFNDNYEKMIESIKNQIQLK